MQPVYHPWLFDDRNAWERAVSDPRWSYDLPISHFMALYNEYRQHKQSNTHTPNPSPPFNPSTKPAPSPAPQASPAQILSQNEIDALLSQLGR